MNKKQREELEYHEKYGDVPTPGAINYSGGPVPHNEALDNGFYGHIMPNHFAKTAIIKTTGRFK
mgnify:CR=1 FL=1